MATYSQRALAVMDALRDASTSAEQATNIADAFCRYVGLEVLQQVFGPSITSVADLTAAQKSQVFVEMMLRLGKRVLREEAEQAVLTQAEADAATSADAAEQALT
jgi:hypothetical protein